MSKEQNKQTIPAAERILSVAMELFYKQGYRATGINEVIKKSGVAKATFYSHYPTKDDLCKSYLRGLSEYELSYLDNYTASMKGTTNRFLSVIESLEPWLIDTEFRGCAFLNIASEVPDFNNPLRKEGGKLYNQIHKRIEALCQELVESDAKKYGHFDVKELSNDYVTIFGGAIALAEIYNDIWPVKNGVKTLRRLIGE